MKKYPMLIFASFVGLQAGFSQIHPVGRLPDGEVIYRAEVDFRRFAQRFALQRAPEWCWAASISNIFAFYGYDVPQEEIVTRVYGGLVDMPVRTDAEIIQLLSDNWESRDGRKFHSVITAGFDVEQGGNISNQDIVNELSNGRPLIVCNTSHCMVLTLFDFTQMRAVNASVFDPYTGPRRLSPVEFTVPQMGGQLRFLAAVEIVGDD